MSRGTEENVVFDGPAGRLQGTLHVPADTPGGLAVVCHPHPLHHGTMDNKVVHTAARTFAGLGVAALRFNFRGVGDSEGEFDEAVGEIDDADAAVALLRSRFGALPVWYAGFSFGSYVALKAAQRAGDCAGMVLFAPAIERFDYMDAGAPPCRALVIQGADDDIAPADAVIEWVNGVFPAPELVVIDGAGHFFHGKLTQLRELIEGFVRDA